MLDITLSAHFGSVAKTWADDLMEEFGEKDPRSLRELVDKKVLPEMVSEVCRACEERRVRDPETMQAYAQHAVTQFDRRMTELLTARETRN